MEGLYIINISLFNSPYETLLRCYERKRERVAKQDIY